MVGELRAVWIDAISTFQKYDFYDINFLICELHFGKEDIFIEGKKKCLQVGAKPSIFYESETADLHNFPEMDCSSISCIDGYLNEEQYVPPGTLCQFSRNIGTIEFVDVEKPVCKACTDLSVKLTKSEITIQRQKSEQLAQANVLKQLRDDLKRLREENEKLRTEIASFHSAEVCMKCTKNRKNLKNMVA